MLLKNIKFSGLSWKGNDGFYYSSYDKPKEGSALSAKTQYHKLFYHKLGTDQSDDRLIFGGEKQPRRYIFAGVTEDEKYLTISASNSTSRNELYIQDISKRNSRIVNVVDNFEQKLEIVQKWQKDYHTGTLKTDKEISRAPGWTQDFLGEILGYIRKPSELHTYDTEYTVA